LTPFSSDYPFMSCSKSFHYLKMQGWECSWWECPWKKQTKKTAVSPLSPSDENFTSGVVAKLNYPTVPVPLSSR
jgi:hypothetical protein